MIPTYPPKNPYTDAATQATLAVSSLIQTTKDIENANV